MADPQIEWPDLSSHLVHFPDYVHAIGMMVVEMTSLEVMLGDLLAALSGLLDGQAHQIYFSPKTTMARLDMLTNLVECDAFGKFPEITKGTYAITKRAKALMDKRHGVIHAHWYVSYDDQMVGRIRPPFHGETGGEDVKLEDLTRLVNDTRQLTRDARYFSDQVEETLRPDAWPERRALLARSAALVRRDNLRLEALLQARKDPPEPSQA
jgi:hypothetical protein